MCGLAKAQVDDHGVCGMWIVSRALEKRTNVGAWGREARSKRCSCCRPWCTSDQVQPPSVGVRRPVRGVRGERGSCERLGFWGRNGKWVTRALCISSKLCSHAAPPPRSSFTFLVFFGCSVQTLSPAEAHMQTPHASPHPLPRSTPVLRARESTARTQKPVLTFTEFLLLAMMERLAARDDRLPPRPRRRGPNNQAPWTKGLPLRTRVRTMNRAPRPSPRRPRVARNMPRAAVVAPASSSTHHSFITRRLPPHRNKEER